MSIPVLQVNFNRNHIKSTINIRYSQGIMAILFHYIYHFLLFKVSVIGILHHALTTLNNMKAYNNVMA